MTKDGAIERIKTMKRTPRMWAQSKEGFLFLVSSIIELVFELSAFEYEEKVAATYKVNIGRPNLAAVDYMDRLDQEFADMCCDEALKTIYACMK